MKFIHYWTDNPTSQYRNTTIFSVVAKHPAEFGLPAAWNYFVAAHDKGPCQKATTQFKMPMISLLEHPKQAVLPLQNTYFTAKKIMSPRRKESPGCAATSSQFLVL